MLADGSAGQIYAAPRTPGDYYSPAFSPDGKRLALAINDGKRSDIWVYEWAHDTLTRLTFAGANINPIWTPDCQKTSPVSKVTFIFTFFDDLRRKAQPQK
jgi:Tol biopolymer transport system component